MELRKVEPGGVGLENSKSVAIFVKGNVFRVFWLPIFVDFQSGQLAIAGSCNEGQKGIQDMFGVGGLTFDVTTHLEQPPGNGFELEESQLHWKMNANYFWSLLISFLDVYCLLIALITWHVHRAIFGVPIWPKITRWRSCVGLKGSVGMGNSVMQMQHKLGTFSTNVMLMEILRAQRALCVLAFLAS